MIVIVFIYCSHCGASPFVMVVFPHPFSPPLSLSFTHCCHCYWFSSQSAGVACFDFLILLFYLSKSCVGIAPILSSAVSPPSSPSNTPLFARYSILSLSLCLCLSFSLLSSFLSLDDLNSYISHCLDFLFSLSPSLIGGGLPSQGKGV